MTTEPTEHVDEKLREAFPVDAAAATRVAGHALAGRPRQARRWARLRTPDSGPRTLRLRASLALAAVALAAGLAVWLSRPTIGPAPGTRAPAGVAELFGSFVDGVLIVPIPDDVIVIAGPGRREDRPSDGSGIVFVEGDVR